MVDNNEANTIKFEFDKFTASKMPEHPATHGTYSMAQMNENHHGVKDGSKSVHKTTAPYKCDLCDFTTNGKYYLKSHKRYVHYGSLEGSKLNCPLCDFTSRVADLMIKHYIKSHPMPQQDKIATAPLWLKLTAMEGQEHSSTHGTSLIAQKNENHHGVKDDSKNVRKMTAPYECELCDFKTNRKYDLNSHKRYDHNGSREGSKLSCHMCDFSSTVSNVMSKHYSEFHPLPPQDKPATVPIWLNNQGDRKKKNTTKAVAKNNPKPKEKSRTLRDLHNAMERQRRVKQHIGFDQLKDSVPKLRDANRASKVAILDGAAEHCKMLAETDHNLSEEREQEAKRNAELRQRLEEAKQEFVRDKMSFFNTAPSYGLMDDFGYSNFEGIQGMEANSALNLIPPLEYSLDTF